MPRKIILPRICRNPDRQYKIPWAEIEPLLGTMPDGDLGQMFDVTQATIARRRKAMGLPLRRKSKVPWEDAIPLMGTMPDSEIAKRYNVTITTIRQKRERLGIPRHGKGAGEHPLQDFLGKAQDSLLAEAAGITQLSVWKLRTRRGIPKTSDIIKKGSQEYTDLVASIRRALRAPDDGGFLRTRTCQTPGCGKTFPGGPRAWFCPVCREDRSKEASARYKRRRREGLVRELGSTDQCEVCGRDYEVTGGAQRYCPSCAPEAIKAVDARQGLEYYRANTEQINPARKIARRRGSRKCVICGEWYDAPTVQITCGNEECAATLQRINQRRADAKRRGRSP